MARRVTGWVRNTIYLSVLGLALPWLSWRRYKTGRYQTGLKQKLFGLSTSAGAATTANTPDATRAAALGDQPTIWLHGVSVGEIQLLKPLVCAWQARHPAWRFAVSCTTDSGMQVARSTFGEQVRVFYFPLDFTWAISRTLDALRPDMLVLGELELWPNTIDACCERNIPVTVVNGRLSERSFSRYRQFSWLTRPMFGKLRLIAAQSDSNAQRFRLSGAATTTIVTGSIKFDNVSFDRQAPQVAQLRSWAGLQSEHRVWVMGSTQVGEEIPAVQTWQQLKSQFPLLKLIIVPRHPDRFQQVAEEIKRLGVRLQRRSASNALQSANDWDVLLVDSLGELKWWWGLAEIAVVGGSFGARGGQNMLEPAAYGANVAFGPNTSNFRDIVELLLAGDAAARLSSLDELSDWLRDQLLNPEPGQLRGSRAQAIIARSTGALDRTLDALDELLDSPSAVRRSASVMP